MKHYQWPVNWGLGALMAGGWSLPALAVEISPEPFMVEAADAAQLSSSSSQNGIAVRFPGVTAATALPGQLLPSVTPLGDTVLEKSVASLVVNATGSAASEEAGEEHTALESTVVSLAVNASGPASSEAVEDATTLTSLSPDQPASALGVVELSAVPQASEHFDPEFSQVPLPEQSGHGLAQVQRYAYIAQIGEVEEGSGDELAQAQSYVTGIGEAEERLQSGTDLLLAQTEDEENTPLDEEDAPVEQTQTILDNSDVPAGDLLESVDGLEDTGIAGEGATTEELAPATSGEDALDGDAEPVQGTGQAGDSRAEPDAEDDGFDSEDFEAEDFDFEEDEGEIVPNPPGATVDGESEEDPDLGVLRLRERPPAKKKTPLNIPVFLTGNVGYIGNGNTLAGVDPVNDRLFRSGISLIASPRLSKRTALIASVQGNLSRYDELSRLDFNEVRLQTSLRRVLTRKVYGDLGWTHRQLFLQDGGDRFLYEHAAFANLTRRDPLTQKTSLTSFYNFRAGFADPETSSRLRNTLGVSLRHDLSSALQASVTGRMTLTNFTQQSRQDFYTQALAQLSYKISKNFRLSAFGSLTRGNSSTPQVDFDNSTIGVSLSGNLKLF